MKLNYIFCVHTETLRYLRNMDSCVFIAASIIIYNNKTNRKTQALKEYKTKNLSSAQSQLNFSLFSQEADTFVNEYSTCFGVNKSKNALQKGEWFRM